MDECLMVTLLLAPGLGVRALDPGRDTVSLTSRAARIASWWENEIEFGRY